MLFIAFTVDSLFLPILNLKPKQEFFPGNFVVIASDAIVTKIDWFMRHICYIKSTLSIQWFIWWSILGASVHRASGKTA